MVKTFIFLTSSVVTSIDHSLSFYKTLTLTIHYANYVSRKVKYDIVCIEKEIKP